jgi:hypothetical protein
MNKYYYSLDGKPGYVLICHKGRNSFLSVKLARIKSLNPVPYRHVASFLIS